MIASPLFPDDLNDSGSVTGCDTKRKRYLVDFEDRSVPYAARYLKSQTRLIVKWHLGKEGIVTGSRNRLGRSNVVAIWFSMQYTDI